MEERPSGVTQDLREIAEHVRPEAETVQHLVSSAVRGAILSGVLRPRTRLRQEELAEVFGTSRIPVREALRALEFEGLVTSEPHRGFTVTSLDAEDVDEIYDLRILVESHAIRLAIPLLTSADMEALEAKYQAMTEATTREEEIASREAFYDHLYSITGRHRLMNLIARLRQEVSRARRWPLVQYSPTIHDKFFDAVREGDAETAIGHLTAHYQRVALLIKRYLREDAARLRLETDQRRPGRPRTNGKRA